jgi:hypothetical protein
MEDFISKIELIFKNKKIFTCQNFKNIDKFFLLPGTEIWQIIIFFNNETGEILEEKKIKLTTILKFKNYERL